jgi:hypothetical protein
MAKPIKKFLTIIAVVIILVAFFQVAWPSFYPAFIGMNQYPTVEYLQIMNVLSPNGLSLLTVVIGSLLLARAAFMGS